MAPPKARRSQGRRKLEMKMIPDESARIVTFSKRRAGIFKKATELSVLCGAQIAIIVFSPGGRAHSFGHPNIESVLDQCLNRSPMPNLQDSVEGMNPHSATLQPLKEQWDQMNRQLENEKRRGKEIEAALENSPFQITEERVKMLDLHQLQHLKQVMEKLRENMRHMVPSLLLDSVEPPGSTDVAGPSDPVKAAHKIVEMDDHDDLDLASVEGDGRDALPIPPVELRSRKDELATDARNGRDGSPIPHDWLSL